MSAQHGQSESAAMKRMHTIARLLCFFRNRDWRYDPGNPKHEHWREKARRIMWELDKVENGGCHDFPLRGLSFEEAMKRVSP
jgi:hypothetical protein